MSKLKNVIAFLALLSIAILTTWTVRQFHEPGHLDVVAAQAMDMSQMRPPTGAAPVELVDVKSGSLDDTVTYTGSVQAYNEQDISPRIAGAILSMPVYPGDRVTAGELVAQLDSAEVGAKTAEAVDQARAADINAQVAHLTHHLHHRAALAQADAQLSAANQSIDDARAEQRAAQDEVPDAQAAVRSAQANADYWKTEVARKKRLLDEGLVARRDYENEFAQEQEAIAAVNQA